jgi:hypothetical protein
MAQGPQVPRGGRRSCQFAMARRASPGLRAGALPDPSAREGRPEQIHAAIGFDCATRSVPLRGCAEAREAIAQDGEKETAGEFRALAPVVSPRDLGDPCGILRHLPDEVEVLQRHHADPVRRSPGIDHAGDMGLDGLNPAREIPERFREEAEDGRRGKPVLIGRGPHQSRPNTASMAPRMSSAVKGFLM